MFPGSFQSMTALALMSFSALSLLAQGTSSQPTVTGGGAGEVVSGAPFGHNGGGVAAKRLVVLAGQSNMLGRNVTGAGNWRSPNPKCRILDFVTGYPGVVQFADLVALQNSGGDLSDPPAVGFCGPEMQFAERVAQFGESGGLVDGSEVCLVKAGKSGSFVYPWQADLCWNPAVVHNLYDGFRASPRPALLGLIDAAVAALGGWLQVSQVDFFWYQGESDALYAESARMYRLHLDALIAAVRADLAPASRLHFHIVRLHRGMQRGPAPGAGGVWFLDEIRRVQEAFVAENADARLVDIDGAEIAWDRLHMTDVGYDTIGDELFGSWLQTQTFDTLPRSRAWVYGVGCAGSNGIPMLAPASPPALGAIYSLHASSIAVRADAALLITGSSRTSSSLGPLPLDLQPLGLGAGCTLLTSIGATQLFMVSAGAGSYDLSVPNSHALAGLPLHHQAASIDAGAPGGFAMSNGVRGIVGL